MLNTTAEQRHALQIFAVATISLMVSSLMLAPLQAVELINGAHSPLVDALISGVTNLGDGVIILPIFIFLLFKRVYWAMGLLFNGILQGGVVSLCKRILFPHALRPINFLDHDTIHIISEVKIHKLMSFPSGHTVTAFGIFIFIALYLNNRGASWMLMIAATLVAISRVYLLQHFLWDVAAGAVIGSAIGMFAFFVSQNIVKPKWMYQRLEVAFRDRSRSSWS
ncbi:phosphatase PAP2 family protein [Chryseolinea sp. T2]|uniref:phosphatase PAP2 family protein n=1 Tax=Chryseolinea sp. T2 TaxID=3129255 RepID=UPI0030783407